MAKISRKKAQASVQFNWIFVLIAGTIILLFFIGIIIRQGNVSERRLAGSIGKELDSIIVGAGLSSGTTDRIQIPDIDINFECDKDGDSWFGVDWENTGFQQNLPSEVVFAPDLIKGNEMITWALDFSAPFKIMNFLYITSPQVRYVFVGSSYASKIQSNMPEGTFTQKMSPSQIKGLQDLNNYKVRFVYFGSSPREVPPDLRSMPDKDVSAIKIEEKTVKFYRKKGAVFKLTGQSYHLEQEPLIYGAIFSEDKEFFDCNFRKMIQRLGFVTEIYAEREDSLQQRLKSTTGYVSRCVSFYAGTINKMEKDIDSCISDPGECEEIDITAVERDNENLKRKSCPLLY